jgi:hypothetical protein
MFSLCLLYAFLKLLTVFDLFISPGVLHVSAGPHTLSQGDPGDPDIRYTHLLMIPTDVLHVSAGPHTPSQGDPGDPDIVLVYQMPNWHPSIPY